MKFYCGYVCDCLLKISIRLFGTVDEFKSKHIFTMNTIEKHTHTHILVCEA